MPDMEIRPARAEDVPGILDVLAAALGETAAAEAHTGAVGAGSTWTIHSGRRSCSSPGSGIESPVSAP